MTGPSAPVPRPREVRGLVVLGDSTAVGIGDPVPGGWRGFGPLLRDALGAPGALRYANLAFPGARIGCVRHVQLAPALRLRADVAVLVVGMNDTWRSDFDPARLADDYQALAAALRATATTVLTVRYHDHGRVFWLPGRLRRALGRRIEVLNTITDAVVARHRLACLDLHLLPGGYDRASWSVDRLHPSELGHRLLAHHFARLVAEQGHAVPHPVDLAPAGGRRASTADHLHWLTVKGVPWVWRRGRDLAPAALAAALPRPRFGAG